MINYIYVVSFSYVHTLLHLIKASKEVANFKTVLEMMISFKQSLFEFLLSVTHYFHICQGIQKVPDPLNILKSKHFSKKCFIQKLYNLK